MDNKIEQPGQALSLKELASLFIKGNGAPPPEEWKKLLTMVGSSSREEKDELRQYMSEVVGTEDRDARRRRITARKWGLAYIREESQESSESRRIESGNDGVNEEEQEGVGDSSKVETKNNSGDVHSSAKLGLSPNPEEEIAVEDVDPAGIPDVAVDNAEKDQLEGASDNQGNQSIGIIDNISKYHPHVPAQPARKHGFGVPLPVRRRGNGPKLNTQDPFAGGAISGAEGGGNAASESLPTEKPSEPGTSEFHPTEKVVFDATGAMVSGVNQESDRGDAPRVIANKITSEMDGRPNQAEKVLGTVEPPRIVWSSPEVSDSGVLPGAGPNFSHQDTGSALPRSEREITEVAEFDPLAEADEVSARKDGLYTPSLEGVGEPNSIVHGGVNPGLTVDEIIPAGRAGDAVTMDGGEDGGLAHDHELDVLLEKTGSGGVDDPNHRPLSPAPPTLESPPAVLPSTETAETPAMQYGVPMNDETVALSGSPTEAGRSNIEAPDIVGNTGGEAADSGVIDASAQFNSLNSELSGDTPPKTETGGGANTGADIVAEPGGDTVVAANPVNRKEVAQETPAEPAEERKDGPPVSNSEGDDASARFKALNPEPQPVVQQQAGEVVPPSNITIDQVASSEEPAPAVAETPTSLVELESPKAREPILSGNRGTIGSAPLQQPDQLAGAGAATEMPAAGPKPTLWKRLFGHRTDKPDRGLAHKAGVVAGTSDEIFALERGLRTPEATETPPPDKNEEEPPAAMAA